MLDTKGPKALADWVVAQTKVLLTDTTMRDGKQGLRVSLFYLLPLSLALSLLYLIIIHFPLSFSLYLSIYLSKSLSYFYSLSLLTLSICLFLFLFFSLSLYHPVSISQLTNLSSPHVCGPWTLLRALCWLTRFSVTPSPSRLGEELLSVRDDIRD